MLPIRCCCAFVVLTLVLTAAAGAADCVPAAEPFFTTGTTAEVVIFNGQGIVSYANFNLQYRRPIGQNPPMLDGVANQLFNDRKAGEQPFNCNRADKLELIMNLTTFNGKRSLEVAFVLGSWGNATSRFYEQQLSCPGEGYITVADGGGFYVIHLRRG